MESLKRNPLERRLIASVQQTVAAPKLRTLDSADEEIFQHAQLWKNLLRRECTVKLWEGERGGRHVEAWGNAP